MFAIGVGCLLVAFLLAALFGREAPLLVQGVGGAAAAIGVALMCLSIVVALYRWGGMP